MHSFGKQRLHVELHLPYLWTTTTQRQSLVIPDDLSIVLDSQKAGFISRSGDFRQRVEADLRNSCCSVLWPKSDSDTAITLRCTFDPSKDNTSQVEEWTTRCRNIVDGYLRTIITHNEEIPGDVWQDFSKELVKSAELLLAEIHSQWNQTRCCFQVTGKEDVVEKLRHTFSTVKSTLNNAPKSELLSNLSSLQLQFLHNDDFLELLPKNIQLSFINDGVVLTGTCYQIAKTKSELQAYSRESTLALSKHKLDTLRKKEVHDHFRSGLRTGSIQVAWVIADDSVKLLGKNSVNINDARLKFDKELIERKIPLDQAAVGALRCPEWTATMSNLSKKYKLVHIDVDFETSVLVCCGIQSEVNTTSKEIASCLETAIKTCEHWEAASIAKISFMQKHLCHELDSLTEPGLDFQPIVSGDKSGFSIKGTHNVVEKVRKALVSLCNRVFETQFETSNDVADQHQCSCKCIENAESHRKITVVRSCKEGNT